MRSSSSSSEMARARISRSSRLSKLRIMVSLSVIRMKGEILLDREKRRFETTKGTQRNEQVAIPREAATRLTADCRDQEMLINFHTHEGFHYPQLCHHRQKW